MAFVREDWLKLTSEEAIAPDILICDPHHHLWFGSEHTYSVDDFLKDSSGGHRISQTVFIESRMMLRTQGSPELQPVGETEFVQKVTPQNGSGRYTGTQVAAGIVGFADLTLGEKVMPVLEAHIAAGSARFKGIRHSSAWDASSEIKSRWAVQPELLLDTKFRQGFACLLKYNLSFDAMLYHTQLPELLDMARTFPDIIIVVNHTGGPLGVGPYAKRRKEVFKEWERSIAALAACPNVYMKLGGLGMEICGFAWHERRSPSSSLELASALSPYYLYCIEQFGVNRCMFESNFPVDKRSYSYTVLWNAFKRMTEDFSSEERSALFHDTAVKAYRLTNDGA